MNDVALAFELVLLSRMADNYQQHVLREAGLTSERAAQLRERSPLQYPSFLKGESIDDYERMLGVTAERRTLLRNADLSPSHEYVQHDFALTLWPHLYWSVYAVDKLTYSGGFLSREEIQPSAFDPANLQPGKCCLSELEALGVKWSLVDGWSEQVILHMDFPSGSYEGEFVFGLLQSWRAITSDREKLLQA
jgi:hypothetical protein